MKSKGEQIIIEELSHQGLRAERFSKQEMKVGKTPDFRVYQGEEFVFYCKVISNIKSEFRSLLEDSAPRDGENVRCLPY
ncbi:MAG: hypothetical protein P4L99_14910 [Chthoniobacter sp.]|nr:hypothetical protein [Chthoniobacter sp.]